MKLNRKSYFFCHFLLCFYAANASLLFGDTPTILFFGDSLTAGYGLEPDEAYPARIQEKIEKEGLNFKAVNGGLSGETSAGGLRRIQWMLRRPIAILILALGSNDGLRGLDPMNTRQNLQAIMDQTRQVNPHAVFLIAGLKAPPNMGSDYSEMFDRIFHDLAKINNSVLIPFLLEDVAGIPSLNQADGIHPNSEGHHIIADNVWKYLRPVL